MKKSEHEFRMCFDPDYSKKHEFVEKWVSDHNSKFYLTFFKSLPLVFWFSAIMLVATRQIWFPLGYFVVFFITSVYIHRSSIRGSRKIADQLWNDFPHLRK